MTSNIERLRALLCAGAAAAWLAGPAACAADNMLGVDTGDETLVQYMSLSYDATNDRLLAGHAGGVKLFAAADGRKLQEIAGDEGTFNVMVGPAGGMIVAGDAYAVRVYDRDGTLQRAIP